MEKSQNDWYASFLLPELKSKLNETLAAGKDEDQRSASIKNLSKISYHLNDLSGKAGVTPGSWMAMMNYDGFNKYAADQAKGYIDSIRLIFRTKSQQLMAKHDSVYNMIVSKIGEDEFLRLRDRTYNENLADIVLNNLNKDKIYDAGNRYIQKADPIFMPPGSRIGRSHFFAPYKLIGNLKVSTLIFNVALIWIMVLSMFLTLYYDLLKKLIVFLESLKLPILKRRFGRNLH